MKKLWIAVLLILSLGTVCCAAESKVEAPEACVKCGMDRTKFGHSRMVVTYEDGTSAGTCSLNCVIEFANAAEAIVAASLAAVADFCISGNLWATLICRPFCAPIGRCRCKTDRR